MKWLPALENKSPLGNMSDCDIRELKKKIFHATIAVIVAEKYLENNPAYDNDVEMFGYNSKEYLDKVKAEKRNLERQLNRQLELPMEADEIEENCLKHEYLDLAYKACLPSVVIDDSLACSEVTWEIKAYWKEKIDNCRAILIHRDEQMGVQLV